METIAVTADGRRALIGSWTEHSELIDVEPAKKWATPRLDHDGWQGGGPPWRSRPTAAAA